MERVNAAGLPVELEVRGSFDALPAGPDLAVYRIVQESLTNILKHADATRARVLIDRRPDQVSVEVVDDGRGAASRRTRQRRARRATGCAACRSGSRRSAGRSSPAASRTGGFAVRAVLRTEEPT